MTQETIKYWAQREKECGCTKPTSKDGFGNEWCNKCYKTFDTACLPTVAIRIVGFVHGFQVTTTVDKPIIFIACYRFGFYY